MVTVTIESESKLSNSGYHRSGGSRSKKSCWWLRGPDGFIDIGYHRGDSHISLEMELEPGTYTLGTGDGKDAIRQTIKVK